MELEVEGRVRADGVGRIEAEVITGDRLLSRWSSTEAERVILAAYRDEVAGYRARIRQLADLEPDEVMLEIGAIHARLGEIRADLIDSTKTKADHFRNKIVDPLRDDLQFQFKVHSRRLSAYEFELGMTTGRS